MIVAHVPNARLHDLVMQRQPGSDGPASGPEKSGGSTGGSDCFRQDKRAAHNSRMAIESSAEIAPTTASLVEHQIEELRATIAPDLYRPEAFIPWTAIGHRLAELEVPIQEVQRLVDSEDLTESGLEEALEHTPEVVFVLQLLFVAPAGAGFADGRELPESPPRTAMSRRRLASLAMTLGVADVSPPGARVIDLCRLGLIAVDARRRGFRRRDDINDRVAALIGNVINEVTTRSGVALEFLPQGAFPDEVRGRVRTVIAAEGRPVAAVATVFQAVGGGRQQRDLSLMYPRLQEALDQLPCSLLLIADGRGVADSPDRVLREMIEGVAGCMTLRQAERGHLADSLEMAVAAGGARTAASAPLETLIRARLDRGEAVAAKELPVAYHTAVLALARFKDQHQELALALDEDALRWEHPSRVQPAQGLAREFDSEASVRALAELLELAAGSELAQVEDVWVLKGTRAFDQVLPRTLVIAGAEEPPDEGLITRVARLARRASAEATIALLVAPEARRWRASTGSSTLQRTLATSVVVLDPADLPGIAGAVVPRDVVVRTVLAQADLTKANPFNYTGATRREMFFGREQEESQLLNLLSTNSAALIGGRKIGKTSLLQATIEVLRREGRTPYYADCQEAGDWRTFVAHIAPRWNVELSQTFRPALLAELVGQLDACGDGPVIIALDEVDNLLRWDLEPHEGVVREAFFRACRALSQEGRAQFVFSGERLLAERLWDASSPHWNFCRPVPVKQLDRSAADHLVSRPLASLGVELVDAEETLDLAWMRTEGHPQLLQFIGDLLVRRLNERPATQRGVIDANDVDVVTDTGEFRRTYVQTYWGQAEPLERVLSAFICLGRNDLADLRAGLVELGHHVDPMRVLQALRMLDLYGIAHLTDRGADLRTSWMPIALEALGGADTVVEDSADAIAA